MPVYFSYEYPGKIVAPLLPSAPTSTANASNNTKGSWASVIDPLDYDIYGLFVHCLNATANRDHLIDIGIGPTGGGSEVVVISNLLFSSIPAGFNGDGVFIPLHIPLSAGKRLSVRSQCSTGSTNVIVSVTPIYRRQRFRQLRTVETYGAATADSGGTSIDPGAVANNWGSYVTLGTTTNRINEIFFSLGNQLNTARTSMTGYLELASGATPDVLISGLIYLASTTNDMVFPQFVGPIAVDIPAGTAVKVRTQCNITDATDRLIDVAAYGLSYSA